MARKAIDLEPYVYIDNEGVKHYPEKPSKAFQFHRESNFFFCTLFVDRCKCDFKKHITEAYEDGYIKYAQGQMEVCPLTEKIHWHIRFQFTNKKTKQGKVVQKVVCKCPWYYTHRVEIVRHEDSTYCVKPATAVDGTQFEMGVFTRQGVSIDLSKIHQEIKNEKKGLKTIIDEYPEAYCRYRGGIESMIRVLNDKPRDFKPYVFILKGDTRIGKTSMIQAYCKKKKLTYYDQISTSNDGRSYYYPNYNGEDVLIFNEFNDNKTMSFGEFKQFTDHTPYILNYKGGQSNFNSKIIFITSNKRCDYYDWFFDPNHDEHAIFLKRVNVVSEYVNSIQEVNDFLKICDKIYTENENDKIKQNHLKNVEELLSWIDHGDEANQEVC